MPLFVQVEFLGEFFSSLLQHLRNVEVEVLFLPGVVVGMRFNSVDTIVHLFMVNRHISQHVDERVLMLRENHHPGTFLSTITARHDCGNELVESILPYSCPSIFFLFLQGLDIIGDLINIKHVIVKRSNRILFDLIVLITAQLFILGVIKILDIVLVLKLSITERIVILLEHKSKIQVAVSLEVHDSVVAVERLN